MLHISHRTFIQQTITIAAGLTFMTGWLLAANNVLSAGDAPQTQATAGAVGDRTGPEWKTFRDSQSGVEVVQLTDGPGDSHHFYFTNPGWYDNGRKLLLSSHRKKRTNLYGIDLTNGEIEQLTDLEPVPLPREVELFRACTNSLKDEVYFWHDLDLMAMDLKTKQQRKLHQLEPGWCISMINCAADGKHIYFGIWEDQSDKFHTDMLRGYVGAKETFKAKPLSKIIEVNVDTGKTRTVWKEKYWIGHVNTSPTQANLLTFCHEGPWKKVDQRIWGLDVDTGRVWKIRPTSGKEAVGHEYWFADGQRIGYHGRDARGKPMFGWIRHDGTDRHETHFRTKGGGHIFSHDERLIVGDFGGVIQIWKFAGQNYLPPRVLCRHDSSMRTQFSHPHPVISPDGKYVVFTSDRGGHCNVYKVDLVDFDRLPLTDKK